MFYSSFPPRVVRSFPICRIRTKTLFLQRQVGRKYFLGKCKIWLVFRKMKDMSPALPLESRLTPVKDGAYYCYCAYVLRISRYSDFLLLVLINTGICFARFKTMLRKQNLARDLGIQKENWGTHAFFRDN